MANNISKSIDTSNFIPSFFLIAYLCLGFVPNLEAVDKIAPQWLLMSVLNFIALLFIFFNRDSYSKRISNTLSTPLSFTYIGFIVWAAFSYFYAINSTEVLVNISRQVNVLIMYLSMGIFVISLKSKTNFISYVIISILSIEIYAVLNEALGMYNTSGSINSGILKGVTANRNITAFSIAIKIPFVLFLIYSSSKLPIKLISGGIITLSFLCLTMIQSRASFLAAGLILIAFLGLYVLLFIIKKERKYLYQLGYLFIPFLLAIVINQTLLSDKGADALARASTISAGTNDGSVNQRLRYYEDVLTHVSSHPVFGVGLGNWKLKSIDYDAKDIVGYIVPYHAHSDFIQLGAELGIFGFLLYLGIFVWAVIFVYKILRYSDISIEEKVFLFLILTALGVYSIDANLNFPIARPQVLVVWTLIMALINYYYSKEKQNRNNNLTRPLLNYFFLGIGLTALIPSIYVSSKVYESLKGQMFLLQDFNSNQFNVPINRVDNIVPQIPNITVTTIPINSIKARYYFNAKKYDKAIELLNEGIPANPYLFFSENLKAQIFLKQNKIDSAFVNARKAFYGLPKNALHASTYAQAISLKSDLNEAKKVFEVLSDKSGELIWKNFLIVLSQMVQSGEKDFIKYASQASKIYPNDKELFSMKKLAVIGQSNINSAQVISNEGLAYFNNKLYVEAAIEFENAANIDSLEYAHFENAASAYFMAGDYGKSLQYSDKVIYEFQPKTGKSEYINALSNFNIGGQQRACELLLQSANYGYSQAQTTYDQRCN